MILLIVLLALWALLAWWVTRPTSDADVAVFADYYAVPLTSANHPLLTQTLQRSRRFRLTGALVALMAGSITIGTDGWSVFGYIAVGFGCGSLADELTRRRQPDEGRAASLDRRTVQTYVRPWVIAAIALGAAVVAAQVVTALSLTPGGGWFMYAPNSSAPNLHPLPSARVIVGLGGAALGVALVGIVLLRRLAEAPHPAATPAVVAVRHAIRTATIISISGALMLVLGVISVRLATSTTLHDSGRSEAFRWINNLSLIVGLVMTLVGANLSLRAFPRRAWFRRVPSAAPSGEPS